MNDLTDRQHQILAAILTYHLQWGRPPTLRSVADAVGITTSAGVLCHLDSLRRKGYLRPSSGYYGAISLRGVSWEPRFDAATEAGIELAKLYQEITGATEVLFDVPKEVVS